MTINNIAKFGLPEKQGLYDPAFEKDACGVGFVAHIKGKRSHQIVLDANEIMMNMEHRGACGCEANTGDGAGMLTGFPYDFMRKVASEELNAELPEEGHFGAGGSVGWADPDAELAFGYVMNKMNLGLTGDIRSSGLVNACYAAL